MIAPSLNSGVGQGNESLSRPSLQFCLYLSLTQEKMSVRVRGAEE